MNECISNLDFKKKYLIAVSGGADSMALLDMLRKHNFQLVVAHVNYKSRPTSDRDEEIVKNYCLKYNIPLCVCYPTKKGKENFEKWARNERYNFFKKIYDEYKLDCLLLAHHKDDVIETYIMKKERKSVGYNLTVPKENKAFGMNLYRPFYELSKNKIREYCFDNFIEFGDDETNYLPIYARNKLRLERLSKLTDQEKDELFLTALNENKLWSEKLNLILKDYKGLETLNFSKLMSEDVDSQILILYDYIASNLKNETLNEKLSKLRLIDMLTKLKNKSNCFILLKDNIFLVREYEKLWIKSDVFVGYEYVLNEYEELKTPYFEISKEGKNMEGVCILKEDYPLCIRPFKNDDYIKIKDGHKSVRRLYIDKKIPKTMREQLPILLNCKNEILLIPSLYKEVERKSLQSNFFMIKYHKN